MKNTSTNPHAHMRHVKALALWKFTFILLLTIQVRANDGYAQNTVTLTERNVPINKILKKIQRQTGYTYFAPVSLLQKAKHITIDVKDVSLTYALDKVFESQPLTYKIVEKVIIVQARGDVSVNVQGVSINGGGPNEEIRGKITTQEGDPIVGANITVKGTNKVVTTNRNGEFVIDDVPEGSQIEVTFVGYEKKTFIVKSGVKINTSLAIASKELDVAIIQGYGQTTRRLGTGNIGKLNSTDIDNQPVANPLAALQGRISGLEVTESSGLPGSYIGLTIRGIGSLKQGIQPLFIVDGVPFMLNDGRLASINNSLANESIFNSINPGDIESIEVLKDADATAIYGSQGANGVVLITTKKGKAGKTALNISYYSGFGRASQTADLLNTAQYIAMRKEAFANDGVTPTASNAPDLVVWSNEKFIDWKKRLIGGTSKTENLQLSLSGGSELTQFRFSGSYNGQTTVFPEKQPARRGASHLNITHSSSNRKLRLVFSSDYSIDLKDFPSADLSSLIFLPPNMPESYDSVGKLSWVTGLDNPMAYLLQSFKSERNNFLSSIGINWEFLPQLNFKTNLGYNFITSNLEESIPIKSQRPGATTTGTLTRSDGNLKSWILEPQLEFKRKTSAGDFHMLVGGSFQQRKQLRNTIVGKGYTNDDLLGSFSAAGQITVVDAISQYRYTALFSRISYNLSNKYLANINIRRDGSSRFGPANRFATFGAVGLGWIFSEENFIKKSLQFLSYGKIRASYGITGNDQIGDYQFFDAWTTSSAYQYQGTGGILPERLFTPYLEWERNRKFEAAIDLAFFNNKYLLSVAFFNNRSDNQLVNYKLPATTGFVSILKNLDALIQNQGIEIELTAKLIKNRFISWNISGNLTIPSNKLLEYPNLEASSDNAFYVVGKSLRVAKRFVLQGVNPSSGVYTFSDLNSNGSIAAGEDYTVAGTIDKRFYGGIINNFTYKNFTVDFLVQFINQTGNNYVSSLTSVPGTFTNQPSFILSRWQKPGDVSEFQRFTASTTSDAYKSYNNYLMSSVSLTNASFVRLRNLSISYQLPSRIISRIRAQNLSIHFRGQNLFTITKYKGADPETQNLRTLPLIKIYTLGLNLTF